MPEALITYMGQPAKTACDGNCKKAWGISQRPKIQLSDDEDDVVFLADNELEDAPIDPGTYEGGHGKPSSASYFPNKWCVRECERSAMSEPGEHNTPLAAPDFGVRIFNQPSKHAAQQPLAVDLAPLGNLSGALGGFAQKVGSMATEIKPEKMWAIWNKNFGFYIGTWLTREEAIHYHVAQKEPSKNWDFCKKRGDRCVRVEVSAAQQPRQRRQGQRAGGSKS